MEINQSGNKTLYVRNLSSQIYRLIRLSDIEFATGHNNGALMIWKLLKDEEKFELIQIIEIFSDPIRSLLLNEQDIIAGSSNGEIKIMRKS